MEYVFLGLLSFIAIVLLFLIIGIFINHKIEKSESVLKFRQSDNHMYLKEFFSRNIKSKKNSSQLKLRKERLTLRIIFDENNKAYWVKDNIFYTADVKNGRPDFINAERIDTTNMSKNELDKMLEILDNLRRGDTDERGSSRN